MENTDNKSKYLPLWLFIAFIIIMIYPLCLRITSPMIYDDDKNSWVRLFSIISPVIIGGAFIYFGHKIGHVILGFITALICTLSNGVSTFHINVQGDYEACLVLFVVLYIVSYMLLFFKQDKEKEEKKPWDIYLCIFFVSIALGFIAKSWQAVLPLIFLILWCGFRSYKKESDSYQTLGIIFSKSFTYISLILALLIIGVYNFAQIGAYISNPEGIATIPVSDSFNFRYFIFFFPVALIYNFFIKDEKIKNLFLFALCGGLFYLLVIYLIIPKAGYSSSLAIPFFALILGIFIEDIFKRLYEKNGVIFKALPFIIGFVFFIYPFSSVVSKNKNTFDLTPLYYNEEMEDENQYAQDDEQKPDEYTQGIKDRTKEIKEKALGKDSSDNVVNDIRSLREKQKQMDKDRKEIQNGINSANETLQKLREKFDFSTFFENLKNIVCDFLGIDNNTQPTKENIEKIYKQNIKRHRSHRHNAPSPQVQEPQHSEPEQKSAPQEEQQTQPTENSAQENK